MNKADNQNSASYRRIIYSSQRATCCTTKLHTERYLTLSGIHDFVQQVARYDSLKLRYGNRHFRVKGFFVGTVDLNTKVVENYIRNQEKEDMVVNFHKPLEGLVKYRPLQGSLKTARFTCGLLFPINSLQRTTALLLIRLPFNTQRDTFIETNQRKIIHLPPENYINQ